jgi:Spy/CpxP family protein refolding chaperone
MRSIKSLVIAAALLAGASSFAMAASTMSQPTGSSTEQNAAASGGPGTHVGAPKTGTADSNAKVLHNQNGYKANQQ